MVLQTGARYGPYDNQRSCELGPQIEPPATPQERLTRLEQEHDSLLIRQEELFHEVVDGDDSGSNLLSIIQRLRHIKLEIEQLRAACG